MSEPLADHPGRAQEATSTALRHVLPSEDRLMTQRATARVLGVSVSYLRASSCPKHLLPGNGPRGRPLLRYSQSEVLDWARGDLPGNPWPEPLP